MSFNAVINFENLTIVNGAGLNIYVLEKQPPHHRQISLPKPFPVVLSYFYQPTPSYFNVRSEIVSILQMVRYVDLALLLG